MRTSSVLTLVCVTALSGPALAVAQDEAAAATPVAAPALTVRHQRAVPLPRLPPLTVDVTCETPGPVCDYMSHPRRPILVLVTLGDPARLDVFAEALSSTYTVVTPDLHGIAPETARTRLLIVLDHVQDATLGPCCTTNVEVAAVVFMADAADLGLVMLDMGACRVEPAQRVVLVAPREAVRTPIAACSQFSSVGSRMPVVVDPAGRACDQAGAVATRLLGAGRALELDVPPLCTVDPTAAASCACDGVPPSDQAFLARALVAILDPQFVGGASPGRAFLEQSQRDGRAAFTEHVPHVRAPVGFAFNLTLGGGVYARDRASGRDARATGPALSFRPELTFGRAEDDDVGFGLYGEVGSTGILGTQDVYLGAGAHIVLPAGNDRAIVPSFGVHGRFGGGGPGVSAGLYVGHRVAGGLEWPVGVRLDARIGLSGPRDHAFILSIQGELLAPIAMIAMAAGS